jgi:hypothetical protein
MRLKNFVDKATEVPIFGNLLECDAHDHWESLGQSTVLFVLSTMPIWLGTLIVYATGEKVGSVGFKIAFYSTINKGELFMYATAFLAPIFWIALTD